MTDRLNLTEILKDADWLEEQLNKLPEIKGPDWSAAHANYRGAIDNLVAGMNERPTLPKIKVGNDGAACRWHGIRCTSTSGAAGAMRNWIARVRAMKPGAAT